jgi:hypothetical protein
MSYDESQSCFSETGRTGEQDVVEGIAAICGGSDHDLKTFDCFLLSGEIIEGQGSQSRIAFLQRTAHGFSQIIASF